MSLPPVDVQTWFFPRLLDSTAQPFVVVDLDLRFVLTNPAFVELTGYTSEELRSMTVLEITPERWQGPGLEAMERLLSTGRSVRYEKEYRRKDGSLIPIEAIVDVDRDEAGNIRGYFSFVTDATERKQAENALRESEERFRLLYDEAPFGYHEIDLEGRIVNINRTECELLGYSREEMLGRPVVEFVAEDHRETALNSVRLKLRGEKPLVPTERPFLTRDGRRLVVAIEERYRIGPDGRIIGIRSTIQDITARKQTEAALVRSERRARALFEGIEDVVFVHDMDGRILDANPAACRRMGYTREEFLKLRTFDLDDPEFAAGFADRLRSQLEKRTVSFEGRHLTKDGRVIPVDISTSMIQLEDQVAVLAVCRDITERKALEEARRQFAEAEYQNAQEIEAKNRDLSRSEARYRRLTEGAHDAVVVADSDGRITLFNPAAERTFGYDASEIVGHPLTELMPLALRDASGRERCPSDVDCASVGHTVELKGRRKDGEELPLELSLSAVETEGEIQYIGSIRDQTERQRMRAMLVQSEKLASIGLLERGGRPRDQQPAGVHRQQPGRPGARFPGRPGDHGLLRPGACPDRRGRPRIAPPDRGTDRRSRLALRPRQPGADAGEDPRGGPADREHRSKPPRAGPDLATQDGGRAHPGADRPGAGDDPGAACVVEGSNWSSRTRTPGDCTAWPRRSARWS